MKPARAVDEDNPVCAHHRPVESLQAVTPLAKDVAVLEAGVETQLRPNLALNASYSCQFGNGLRDHGFKVNLNWSF